MVVRGLGTYLFFIEWYTEVRRTLDLNILIYNPSASNASREVANLNERKNPQTVYGVKEFVCLSVTNFDPNYLGTGRTEWAEIF